MQFSSPWKNTHNTINIIILCYHNSYYKKLVHGLHYVFFFLKIWHLIEPWVIFHTWYLHAFSKITHLKFCFNRVPINQTEDKFFVSFSLKEAFIPQRTFLPSSLNGHLQRTSFCLVSKAQILPSNPAVIITSDEASGSWVTHNPLISLTWLYQQQGVT